MAGQWVIEDDEPQGQWVIEDGPTAEKMGRLEKIGRGLFDPIDGGAQLLSKILPDSVMNAGNRANNWVADKTGLLAKVPEGGIDQMIQESEAAYQARRSQSGESGLDGYRLLGNILSPANLAVASKIPQGVSLGGRVLSGALGGASVAALNPVTSGDYLPEKAKQIGTGAFFGGATPLGTSALARVVSPKASINPQLALLKSEGVRPTVGQSLGGVANRAEEKLQSLPIVGDAIALARQRSSVDLNRAAANRALFPLNKKIPEGVTGNESVLYVRKALGEAYDDLMPKLAVQQDKAYQQSVSQLQKSVKSAAINPNSQKAFNRFLSDEVNPLFQGQQSMSGETFKRLQSKITEKIQQTAASTDADQRVLNGAYKELGDQLNQLSIRANPQAATKLKAINTGYANFKRLQKASASVASEDGVFTPAMLQSAVRAADRSKDKARFSEGKALMQDLGAAGKNLLSNKVPDSGTAGRVALGAGALATGALNPAIPAGLLGGAALYTPMMQQLLSGAVSARPLLAQPAANMLRKSTPALVPASAYLGLGLLNQP